MAKPLPPMAPVPPADIWSDIPDEDWKAFEEAWDVLARAYLALPERPFAVANLAAASTVNFLASYLEGAAAVAGPSKTHTRVRHRHSPTLRRYVFLLIHRIYLHCSHTHAKMLAWPFLADLSRTYHGSADLTALLQTVWDMRSAQLEASLRPLKQSLIVALEEEQQQQHQQQCSISNPNSDTASAAVAFSTRLLPLLDALPAVGAYLIAGSDLFDALAAAYERCAAPARARLLALASLSLRALMRGPRPNHSMLFDHLYGLRDSANAQGETSSRALLADLVTETPLLAQMTRRISGSDAARARTLATSLAGFRRPEAARSARQGYAAKGKAKAGVATEAGRGARAVPEAHVHRMSLVTQVQDLFPDLGSAFVAALLDEYADSVEQVTAHLLDDSLPASLRAADHAAVLPPTTASPTADLAPGLLPSSTPPRMPSPLPLPLPHRHNIHANDAFDRLAVPASSLHYGRRALPASSAGANANALFDAPPGGRVNKAAIMSALAAFDADDDERDDTYDAADVGGTVDTTSGEAVATAAQQDSDAALFAAWTAAPAVFERDAATRRGEARAALRRETGLTHEAVEGWALMVRRDPRRLKRLEARFGGGAAAFDGTQRAVDGGGGGKWREGGGGGGGSATEDSEASGAEGGFPLPRRGGFGAARARGSGRTGARGAGSGSAGGAGSGVNRESGDRGTQIARQRKEASKGSGANHNRRDQRARKMARGGFGVA